MDSQSGVEGGVRSLWQRLAEVPRSPEIFGGGLVVEVVDEVVVVVVVVVVLVVLVGGGS